MAIVPGVILTLSPLAVFLVFVWGAGRFSKSWYPSYFLSLLWGSLAAPLLATLIFIVVQYFNLSVLLSRQAAAQYVVIPLIEETLKAGVLFFLLRSTVLVFGTDGLIAASLAGLGFGLAENMLLFRSFNHDIFSLYAAVYSRFFSTTVMHGFCTGFTGFFAFTLKKHSSTSLARSMPIILLLPVLVHGSWNYLALLEAPLGVLTAFACVMVITYIVLFKIAAAAERETLEREVIRIKTGLMLEDSITSKILSAGSDLRCDEAPVIEAARLSVKAGKCYGKMREKCLKLYNEILKTLNYCQKDTD